MCLDKITQRFKKSDEKSGIGYKVFHFVNNELRADYIWTIEARPVGRWLHERKFRSPTDQITHLSTLFSFPNSGYSIGWHIFYSRASAYRYVWERMGGIVSGKVRKVAYRDARTIGIQSGRKIIVAKEIFILGKK